MNANQHYYRATTTATTNAYSPPSHRRRTPAILRGSGDARISRGPTKGEIQSHTPNGTVKSTANSPIGPIGRAHNSYSRGRGGELRARHPPPSNTAKEIDAINCTKMGQEWSVPRGIQIGTTRSAVTIISI